MTMISPTLTVVVPFNCNAKCSFCTKKNAINPTKLEKWLAKLNQVMNGLHSSYQRVVISGGEPSLFPKLIEAIDTIGFVKEVELQTNATGLITEIPVDLLYKIDVLNIIRHTVSDELNAMIFGAKDVPTTDELKRIVQSFKDTSVRVELTKVLGKEHSNTMFIDNYIKYAKSLGIKDVNFNKVHSDLLSTESEKHYSLKHEYKTVIANKYRHKTMVIDDVNVVWRATLPNVTSMSTELVFCPNGKLYGDWTQSKEIVFDSMMTPASEDNDDDLGYNSIASWG